MPGAHPGRASRLLRETYSRLPILYVKGNAELLNRHSIAIVGACDARRLLGIKSPRGSWFGWGERPGRRVDAAVHESGRQGWVLGFGRRYLSERDPKNFCCNWTARGHHIGVPHGNRSRATEFSSSQQDYFGMARGLVAMDAAGELRPERAG